MHDTQYLDECGLTITLTFLTKQNNNREVVTWGWKVKVLEIGIFPDFLRLQVSILDLSLCAILPRWRAEDQNLELIYTSPGKMLSAGLWLVQADHATCAWPLIGWQLTSDCCIIPGVCGPASRQFSQTTRGNFSVNTQWRTAANTGLGVSINIKPGLGTTQHATWYAETSVCAPVSWYLQGNLQLQPDMDQAFGGKNLLFAQKFHKQ